MKTSKILFVAALCFCFFAHCSSFAQELWGNTTAGGSNNLGVIFKANADGTGYSVQHEFVITTSFKGIQPQGQPMRGSDGKYYGVATNGGTHNKGILYVYDPSNGTMSQLHDFGSVVDDGANPASSLVHPTESSTVSHSLAAMRAVRERSSNTIRWGQRMR